MLERRDLVFRVARRIATRRRQQGLSQEGLAALLDIAVKNVQRIESGRQNLSLATLERISAALDITPERLIAGAPEPATEIDDARPADVLERLRRGGYTVRRATERGRRPAGAIAVTTLRAAAGRIAGAARAVEVLGWIVLPRRGAPPEGQFVAEVHGASMAPAIPAGALCLFGKPGPPPIDGRILLVAHAALADDELGGPYALKRVRVKKRGGATRVVLESVNPDFPPIALDATEGQLRVIAELVRVLVA
ncbi:MAG: LexA family transcriptional regulator [Labilithrix sp.]|nr:LexA family transcriptional regulator [Labilithrix sp.]MCW5831319.1 LexA family transcriptional regulator [Labilithrix sp.]